MKESMSALRNSTDIANTIQAMARQAARAPLPADALHIALQRIISPVDYMRYAEFEALLDLLDLQPGMTVLDLSSPQWFVMLLAKKHPAVQFKYVNLVPRELDPYYEIARVLGLRNLEYQSADARALNFADNTFDCVVSISVIEHIFPAEGGDVTALNEIARVLKPGGTLLMTVPYKAQGCVVYVKGPVYERNEAGENFFAREYDEAMFAQLLQRIDLALAEKKFICEHPGLFAVDYFEWGPGRNTLPARVNIKVRKLFQRLLGISLDRLLAQRYLHVSDEVQGRVVNIAALLRKA
jgi:ubiquinone/menaquinone biosynthesis C-methylase UbiE